MSRRQQKRVKPAGERKPKRGQKAEPKPTECQKRSEVRSVILLAGLTLLVVISVLVTHWPALSARALIFDDEEYLTKNPLVQNPSWNSARRFMTEILEPSTVNGYYQPLTMISLMLDHAAGGSTENLRPFHRTSLLFHVCNTILLIVLVYMLFGEPWTAAIIGLLFGVHPMTVEPIPWIGERKTLLAAFFSLWSLIGYVRYARTHRWTYCAGCLAMYVLALMSKPTSTPLPICMLLMDFWPLRRLSWRAVLEKLPFFMIGGISATVTSISQSRTAILLMPSTFSPGHIPWTLCHNIVFYPYKMIWPTNLTPHYAFPKPFDWSDTMVRVGVIGTCILIPLLVMSLLRARALLTGWMIFFVAIFPTMGVLGFTNVIASDKYAYLPSVGLLIPLAWYLARWWRPGHPASRARTRQVVMLIIVALLAITEGRAARRYQYLWRDTETLYQHMIAVTPHSPYPYNNLGLYLFDSGRIDEAIERYTQSLQAKPRYYHAHYNLGNALLKAGRDHEAFREFILAVETNPKFYQARNNVAGMLLNRGETDAAIEQLAETLRLKPDYADAHTNMGIALARKGKRVQAIEHYNKALSLKPDNYHTHYNLANTLLAAEQVEEAIKHYHKTLQLKPDLAQARAGLATALTKKSK